MLRLKISGMTCDHCSNAVDKALRGVAGVRSARVSLSEGMAWVDGDADMQAIADAVAEEGYRAEKMEDA